MDDDASLDGERTGDQGAGGGAPPDRTAGGEPIPDGAGPAEGAGATGDPPGEGPPTAVVPHLVGPERAVEFRELVLEADPDLPPGAIRAATSPEESRAAMPDAAAVATFRLPEDLLDLAGDLRWVQALSAGVDHYPLDRLADRGVAVTNASGVHAEPIAEQVLGYVLAFERGLVTAMRNKERGVWERHSPGELRGKTVGILGVGAIGTRVAELCSALGMETIGTKRDTGEVPGAIDEIHGPGGTYEVLREADYAVVACPLTEETRGLVGPDELRALGDEGVLVNVARGEVVQEDALVRSLQNRSIRGAALDVFEEEPLPQDSVLWDLPNVIVTPHNAGSTPHYTERCAELFAENYRRFREDGVGAMRNLVLGGDTA